jgi:hypothetical protein
MKHHFLAVARYDHLVHEEYPGPVFGKHRSLKFLPVPHGFTPFLSAVPSVPLKGPLGRYGGRFHYEFS